MHKSTVGLTSVVLLVAGVAACTTVGLVGYPGEYVATRAPSHVWVTQTGKTAMFDIYNPQMHGDTLAGFDKEGGFMEMNIQDVQLMRAPMASPGRTALLAATLAVGTALVITHIQGNVPNCIGFQPGAANNGVPIPCGTTSGGSGNVVF